MADNEFAVADSCCQDGKYKTPEKNGDQREFHALVRAQHEILIKSFC